MRMGWNCQQWNNIEGDNDKWKNLAQQQSAQRKTEQKRPILTRLSELNSQQLDIISNLRDLGVTVQPVAVRTS